MNPNGMSTTSPARIRTEHDGYFCKSIHHYPSVGNNAKGPNYSPREPLPFPYRSPHRRRVTVPMPERTLPWMSLRRQVYT